MTVESVVTEDTPLLTELIDPNHPSDELQAPLDHEGVYQRFEPRKKRMIVALVSFTGLLPPFVSGTFIPSIPQIANDLNTTGAVVNLAVSLSILTSSIGTMLFATYSGFYGRRPIYLVGLPILVLGSLGVGFSRTVPELLIWRVIQAFGSSGGFSLGAATISDMYKVEERGMAIGTFFAAVLVGPALAPPVGGLAAHYATWRSIQYALAIAGVLFFVLLFFVLPETMHPNKRGIDVYIEKTGKRPRFLVFLNPLSSLGLLRSPNLLLSGLSGFTVLLTDYSLMVPIAYTIGARYNITNEFLIGACFLPVGLGNAICAPISGHLSDLTVRRWKARRHGEWVPEDRLRLSVIPFMTLVPLSILVSGLITTYVDGTVGLVGNLICLFVNGVGVDLVLSPAAAYYVDILHDRSAESMAATTALRNGLCSLAIAGLLPSIERFGVAGNAGIVAGLAWIGAGLTWLTIQYGREMRAWVDIGYSTAANN